MGVLSLRSTNVTGARSTIPCGHPNAALMTRLSGADCRSACGRLPGGLGATPPAGSTGVARPYCVHGIDQCRIDDRSGLRLGGEPDGTHRCEVYVSYSPVFWRTAEGAIPRLARLRERQLARDVVVGFRAVCLRRLGYRLASTFGRRAGQMDKPHLGSDLQQHPHEIDGCWYDASPDGATLGPSPSFNQTFNGDSAG